MSRLRSSYWRALKWSASTDDRFIIVLASFVYAMALCHIGIDRVWPS